MITIRTIAAALATAILMSGCATKHIAYHYREVPASRLRQSVPLWLPRTVLEIRANAELTTKTPSALYSEAAGANHRFTVAQLEAAAARIEVEVGKRESRSLRLLDLTLATHGERDPTQLFYAYLADDWLTAVDFEAEYGPDGLIGSVSSSRESKALEFTLKTLESLSTIGGAAFKAFAQPPVAPALAQPVNIPDQLATRILDLRVLKHRLQTDAGTRAQLDGAGLNRLLDDINREETQLVAQFLGQSEKISSPVVFTVRPERGATVDKIVLAELTADGRFALMGMPPSLVNRSALPDEFQSAANPHGRLVLNLALVDRRESDFMHSLASTGSSSRKLGLPFQTPAQLSAVVAYDPVNGGQPRIDLLRTEVLIGQWGVVGRLPVSMGTPGSSLKPTYYTETGALKKLVVSSRPPAVDSAKSLETAASSIIGGIKARDEANSELAELRKTKEMLELEVAIQNAKTQLGKP